MTKLHEWEVIHSVKVQDYGNCAMTRRLAVPGGWMYEVRAQWDERKPTLTVVPDPTAPHCQPTTADAPPMTDEALREWLTATYGEAEEHVAEQLIKWRPFGGEYDEDDAIYYDASNPPDKRWSVSPLGPAGSARVIGPALWAAHKYGVAG